MPLIGLETLKNTSFIIFFRKKVYCGNIQCFFFYDFLLISLFSSNNKQKTQNIAAIYFFLKKIINDVFFNVFRRINGILNKTPFYKYNICNLNKEENSAGKVTFSRFFSYFHSLSRQYYFSLKLHKLPIFMLLSLFYDNIFIFL